LWTTKISNIPEDNGKGGGSKWKYIGKYKNPSALPSLSNRDGIFEEIKADEATLLAKHLATGYLPLAYLVAVKVLCKQTPFLMPRNSSSQ
jgi:hypothetical protein